jgi:glyoxylase-like metal-dependent hydrolase (beta-lactamase superfamily II)
MKEILPGILTWPWFSQRHGYDFNGHLVRQPGGNICIDPVAMSEDVLDEITREGVAHIVLTNRNHVRDSARLRARTAARLWIHPADAKHAKEQGAAIDDDLQVDQKVGPFVVLAANGKSAGEIALYWPERKILVVGDACVGKPPGACALLPETVMDDPATLRQSLRRLAAEVDFDALLMGDGAPILNGGRAALRALVATFS